MSAPPPPFILAMDVSKTNTGVCFGRVGETPVFLSIRGDGLDDESAADRLGCWFIDFTKSTPVDWLFCEATIGRIPAEYDPERQRVVHKGNPKTAMTLYGLWLLLQFLARRRHIQRRSGNVATIRKAFLGAGYPDDPKRKARAMCETLGWAPKNLDEADAGAIWWWGCVKVRPHSAQIVTPMMQQKILDPRHVEFMAIGRDAGVIP